jgi:small subunit ribosomal protein S24e
MSKGYAKVYESKEAALEYDREYLLKRNGIEAKAPEAAEPAAEE